MTNRGPGAVTNITVTDALPASMAVSAVMAPDGGWTVTNGTLLWEVGLLPEGSAAALSVVVTVGTNEAVVTNGVTACGLAVATGIESNTAVLATAV